MSINEKRGYYGYVAMASVMVLLGCVYAIYSEGLKGEYIGSALLAGIVLVLGVLISSSNRSKER